MCYKERFIACLKSGGKILREKDENVYVPYNSEYTIFLKNMSGQRAVVKVEIDGSDVLDGHSLIVNPNSTFELEGFLKDITAKNKFLFIPKTKEISEFRGDRLEDSLIRISWKFEKMKPIVQEVKTIHTHDYWYYPTYPWYPITYTNSGTVDSPRLDDIQVYCSSNIDTKYCLRSMDTQQTFTTQSCSLDNFVPEDTGITVKGSECDQKFNYGHIGELEENEYTIVLQLKGVNEKNEVVEKPLLVSDKVQCSTCGHISKSNVKYCGNCGTFLG